MEDSLEGLGLPTYSGRLSADWSAHQHRLESWLSLRGVPLHAHEAAEALELSLVGQAALAFEQEAGPAERRVYEDAARWCKERWGGTERRRLAAAAAVNRINARGFRERGQRRETIKDFVSELELLFQQAGLTEDEARKRAFVGCFFEFPQALHRLSRPRTYHDAVAEALSWEAEMVFKEREALTSHLRVPPPPISVERPPSPPSPVVERPVNPTPGNGSPVVTRFTVSRSTAPSPDTPARDNLHFDDDDLLDPTDALVQNGDKGYIAARRSSIAAFDEQRTPYPARSVETLHAYPTSSTTRAQLDHSSRQPRSRSSLAAYPSPESLGGRQLPSLTGSAAKHGSEKYATSCAGPRKRSGLGTFDIPRRPPPALPFNSLQRLSPPVPSASPSSSLSRAYTPPFVTEATSFRSSTTTTSTSPHEHDALDALYASFPYPSRPSPSASPTEERFRAYSTGPISPAAAEGFARRIKGSVGSLRGRSKPPTSMSAAYAAADGAGGGHQERREEKGETGRRKTLLAGLLRKIGAAGGGGGGGKGHRRWASVDAGLRLEKVAEEANWVRPRARPVTSFGRAGPPVGVGTDLQLGRPPKKRAGLGAMGLPP
ncbi:hypothetical protein JCM8097_006302 [Rhodosporidiobolus ruineniae]